MKNVKKYIKHLKETFAREPSMLILWVIVKSLESAIAKDSTELTSVGEVISDMQSDRTDEAWYKLVSQIGKLVGCLPSCFASDNSHIVRKIESLIAKESKDEGELTGETTDYCTGRSLVPKEWYTKEKRRLDWVASNGLIGYNGITGKAATRTNIDELMLAEVKAKMEGGQV